MKCMKEFADCVGVLVANRRVAHILPKVMKTIGRLLVLFRKDQIIELAERKILLQLALWFPVFIDHNFRKRIVFDQANLDPFS